MHTPISRFLFRNIFALLVFAIGPVEALEEEVGDACESYKCNFLKDLKVEVGYAAGKFIGIKRDYAEYGVFLPVSFLNQWVIFADGRAYQFRHSKWGASGGLGIRGGGWCDRILGANVYYDCLESRHDKFFKRIGVGVEWLGACWDIRANGYFPVGSKSHFSKKKVFKFPGGFVSTCRENEFSIGKGFDAEFGLPVWCCDDLLEVYVAAGPYYYKQRRGEFWGGYGRIEVNLRDYLSIEVRTSHDKIYRTHTQVRILLSLPFEVLCDWNCFCEYCQNLCLQPVKRNGIIFTDVCCNSHWNW
ncbi:MAG: hypothetical protein C5B43_04355 [Verrucomicrobia bacterium]|nr:MAG: hypothetical protein C5B43_04355 [Verrucomicrobiota bacterium]